MSVFVAIADGASLSAASRRLRMPLASVSRRLSDLEAHLGTRLITRSTRRLVLTDVGREYLAACRQILEQVDEAERAATGAYADVKGQLVVAAPVAFGRLHMAPVAAAFLDLHDDVDIQLRLGDRNVNLIEEHVDVALRIGVLPDSSLVATPVGGIVRVICASPAYLERFGTPRTIDELAGHRCVGFDGVEDASHWAFEGTDGSRRVVGVRARLTATTADAAIAAAILGVGLTRVMSYQAAEALRDGRLVRVLADAEPAPMPVSLVYPGRRRLPMKTRAFIDFAAARLRAEAAQGVSAGSKSSSTFAPFGS